MVSTVVMYLLGDRVTHESHTTKRGRTDASCKTPTKSCKVSTNEEFSLSFVSLISSHKLDFGKFELLFDISV